MDRAGAAEYVARFIGKVLLNIGRELVVRNSGQYLHIYFKWLVCACFGVAWELVLLCFNDTLLLNVT